MFESSKPVKSAWPGRKARERLEPPATGRTGSIATQLTVTGVDRQGVQSRHRLDRRWLGSRRSGLLAVLAVSPFVLQSLGFLYTGLSLGLDFQPLRHAGQAVLHGRSVYADHFFVYPPSAAPLLLPFAAGSSMAAYQAWLALSLLALLTAAVLIARAARPTFRWLVFAAAVAGLFSSTVAAGSLWLGNLSVLLVPVAVLILLAFHRQHWVLGCAILAGSLLVKPLLAPLLLVPAVRRRWRALLLTMPPAAALLGLAMLLVPGGREFGRVLAYTVNGTNLHGADAVKNLSVRGWAEAQHWPGPAATLLAGAVLGVVAAAVVVRVRRVGSAQLPILWLANVALLTTLLVGRLAEVHFLLTLLATVLLQLVLEPGRSGRLGLLPGLLLLGLPAQYVSVLVGPQQSSQSYLIAGEVLLLAGLLLAPTPRPQPASAPVAVSELLEVAA